MKQIITAIIILSIIGCDKKPEGYSVSGNIPGVEDGTMLYVSDLGQNNQPVKIDSVEIKDEEFILDLPEVQNSNLSFLTIDGVNGNVIYISENEPLEFQINKDSIPTSKVTGGRENELFYSYLNHLKELNSKAMTVRNNARTEIMGGRDTAKIAGFQREEETLRSSDLEYKKNLVQDNPDKFVSVLVLTDMLNMGASSTEVKELYENLSKEVKTSSIAQNLQENLGQRSAVEIGSTAPDFTAPNPEGKQVSLKEAMGKVTLIDFWAAWCKPCRVENPNVVNTYNKYHDQGFNIIGVSLDREGQKERWVQAIAEDKLTWPQVSNLKFWQEPVAQLYGVRAIPAQFILDENGIIVAKNLRGEELDAKVKELLEKSNASEK